MKLANRLDEADKQMELVQEDCDDDPDDFLVYANLRNARIALDQARDRLEGES